MSLHDPLGPSPFDAAPDVVGHATTTPQPTSPSSRSAAGGTAVQVSQPPPALELVWAEDVWDSSGVAVVPTILTRTDGAALLYPGRAHTIAGEPGAGKTWVVLAGAAQLLAAGQCVFYLDFDATDTDVTARLRSLGVTREQAEGRFAYLRADTSRLEELMALLLSSVAEHGPALVVIDGLAAAMAMAGLEENSNRDATRWHQRVIVPLTDAGTTTLTIDHISKAAAANGAPRAGYARGAGAKLANITGAAYLLTSRTGFDAETAGNSALSVLKDRFGRVGARGQVVAMVHFTPGHDVPVDPGVETTVPGAVDVGSHTATLKVRIAPAPSSSDSDRALRDQICEVLSANGQMSRTAVRNAVTGNNTKIKAAITALLADRTVVEDDSGRHKVLLLSSSQD